MKRKIQTLISKITLLIMFMWVSSSSLIAQTWTSADGGGVNGLNNSVTIKAEYPSAAVFNGELYVIWQENFQVHIKKYNGSTWTGAGNVAGQSQLNLSTNSAVDPQIITYNGALYAAWGEFDDGIMNIHVKKYDGSNWTFVQNYAAGDGRTKINHATNANAIKVQLAVFNNELYATWIENAYEGIGIDQTRVSKFNGSLWTSVDGDGSYGLNYNTGELAYKTTLCVYNNKLYVAWSENSSTSISQFRVRRYDGGSTWTFVDGNGATGLNYNVTIQPSDYPLSLSSCNGKLCMFWAESNRIRVKQYDGSTWTSGPEDALGGMNYSTTRPAESPASFAYNNLLYLAWQEHHATGGNNIRQIRVATFDGTTKTFIDGNGVAGINQQITMRAHFPKLIEYSGDLYVMWNEDNSTTSDVTPQIRLKKYPVPGISTSVTVPANGIYKVSTNLDFTVNFNKIENIVGGIPYIPITLNTGGTVNATCISGSGTKSFLFRYTIVSGNVDNDGITIGSSIVLPAGCTLKDAASLDAALTLNSVGSTTAVLVDGIAPSVSSINRYNPSASNINVSSVIYRITFNENVSNVDIDDFSLTNTGTVTGTIASVTAAIGTTIDVTINSITGDGTMRLDLKSSGTEITDNAGNPISSGFTTGQVYTIDHTPPTTTLSSTASDPTSVSPIPVTITFSKPVTGFDAGDIAVTNGSKDVLNGSGNTYTINITPLAIGVVTINVAAGVAQDAFGNSNTIATQLSRTYNNAPTVTTQAVSSIAATTATGNGNITSLGIPNPTQYGVVWSTSTNPTVALTTKTVQGAIASTGTFTSSISGLSANTTYYVKAYATNTAGTSYGSEVSFTTLPLAPTVTTQAVSSITTTIATGNGNITDLGVPNPTAHGVCWNTTGTPTTLDQRTDNGAASSIGAFTASMTSLSPNTTYYVRAFATNTAGTSYGSEVSFVTTLHAPNVTTQAVTDITTITATGNGNIADMGSSNVTEHGVCWITTGVPTITDNKIDNGAASITGMFTVSMASLDPNTTYYVRAFATNTVGTSYGTVVNFTTLPLAATVSTQTVTSITTTTAIGNGNITVLGVPNPNAYGICWNTTGTPTISGNKKDNGAALTTGSFTASMVSLSPNTTYYVRAFATNTVGTSYGMEVNFTTLPLAATVATQAVTSITNTTAIGNGNITLLGVPNPYAYGICWNTTGVPTVTDNKTDNGAALATGAFTALMASLSPNTNYYVRAFATNFAGTSYGNEIIFTTSTTGIDDNKSYGIKVYPNPANEKVSVSLGNLLTDSYRIEIYNLIGCKVYQREVNIPSEVQVIDLKEFVVGIYFIKAYNKQFSYSKKLILR